MLPADGIVEIPGLGSGALSVLVVEVLSTPGNIVHRRELVVQVGQCRPLLRGAVGLSGRAHRTKRRVLPVGGERAHAALIEIGRIALVHVPVFHRDMPFLIELVVVGAAVPLQVIVAVLAVVECVGANEEAVVSAVGDVAQAACEAGLLAGVSVVPGRHFRAVEHTQGDREVLAQLRRR